MRFHLTRKTGQTLAHNLIDLNISRDNLTDNNCTIRCRPARSPMSSAQCALRHGALATGCLGHLMRSATLWATVPWLFSSGAMCCVHGAVGPQVSVGLGGTLTAAFVVQR